MLFRSYFLYDWHVANDSHKWHGFSHAQTALNNASKDFELTNIEMDIIAKHMFPLNIKPPKYRESYIVSLADKICSSYETIISGENMRQFIKELEAKADFVVIDTPPSAMLSDAAIVAQYVDGAVFVIRQDYTEADRILEGMEILSSSGAQITGCILNDANVKGNSSQHYKNSYRLKGEVKV